jgi:diacylglycerol kinase (ATP)
MPSGAVIFHPEKVSKDFRASLSRALQERELTDVTWHETTVEDAGGGHTVTALAAGVDFVIAAGGDGTVRSVANGLAGSDVPLGIVPAGTGNLLARNLDLPLEEAEAIGVALDGRDHAIDLIELTIDGGRREHFAVMAGAGVDAMIMDETDPNLKRVVGPAAYFVAAGKAMGRRPMHLTITIDGGRRRHRRAMLVLIGNVGKLPAGIDLLPDAVPDDGLLDIFVASPRRLRDWIGVLIGLVRRHHRGPAEAGSGRRIEVSMREAENYQLDGDVVGSCQRMVAEIKPGALTVRLPRA